MPKHFWKKLSLFVLAMLPLYGYSKAPDSVEIMPDTPFFEKADPQSKILFVSETETTAPVLENVKIQFGMSSIMGRWHPLGMTSVFHKVLAKPGQEAWFSEDLRFSREDGKLLALALPRKESFVYFLASFGILGLLLVFSVKKGSSLFDGSLRMSALAVSIVIMARITLLLLVLSLSGGLKVYATDENSYFRIAHEILSWNFMGKQWDYTIGTPILYAPFIILSGAKEFFDCELLLSIFNAFVVSPLSLLLAWLIVRKISGSELKAFIVALLWALLPFIIFPFEDHAGQVFKSLFTLPHINAGSYRLYDLLNATGYNGLSDTPSAFLCLSCIALALCLPGRRLLFFAGISALFGFACLLRINNVMLAPLLAYLFWTRLKGGTDAKTIFRTACISVSCFLVVFSPQFIVNKMQFGAFGTFPYILHGNQAWKGFCMASLPSGSKFLIGCNFIFMALGASGLLFIRDKFQRNVIALWALPLILFFCGYVVVGASPTRFILTAYPALLAGLVCASAWDKMNGLCKMAVFASLGLACTLCSPCHRFKGSLPWDLEELPWGQSLSAALNFAVPALLAVFALWLCKRNKRAALFVMSFALVYFIGMPYLILCLFIILLLLVAISWAMELREKTGGAI